MFTITLATGETVQCFNVERGIAYDLIIRTDTLSMAEAAAIFGNKEALKEIKVTSEHEESIYYGYKTLAEIKVTPMPDVETLMIVIRK